MVHKKFYFTNPTYDRHRAQKIRLQIEKEVESIELLSPFYDRAGTPTPEIASLDRGEKHTISSAEIVQTDLNYIRHYDGVVAFVTNKTSWGSITEVVYAWTIGKPVYLIFDKSTQGTCSHCGTFNNNSPSHPFPKELGKQFGTVEGFINFAKKEWGTKWKLWG